MTSFAPPPVWESPSGDPNDETFGDVVDGVDHAHQDPSDPDHDVVLVGEPFDAAVVGRPGAAKGPDAIREALRGVKTHGFESGPVGRARSIGDLGDLAVDSMDPAAIQRSVAEVAADLHAGDAVPVFLGGDNSLTYPNVEPLCDRGSVGVVNLDAHLDVREVREAPTSGTPYRQLFEAGLDAYVCLGARHHETSTAYVDYLEERGGEVVTSEAVGRDLERAVRRARDAVADVDVLYLSVDCDVLEAAAAPGVSAPTPGGLTTRELFRIVRRLAGDDRVAGFEVVECAPPLDEGGRTAGAAARAVAHFLAGSGGGGRD
ncbi:formimidoylglutamase [Natronomonas salina]|uniref:formimidoylglutamase n=1 Tax=Natronomonas salina TaxID=1710540 RepID=UPI0015B5C7EC|nr:formimidoylglutamase [Natronomonas salina]QLD90049.1 formimidoylglutamase [Natronomonas salina]